MEKNSLVIIYWLKSRSHLKQTKHFTQVPLKISGRTLQHLGSHLKTKYITWSIFTEKSVMHITNAIVRQQNEEEMDIVALLL